MKYRIVLVEKADKVNYYKIQSGCCFIWCDRPNVYYDLENAAFAFARVTKKPVKDRVTVVHPSLYERRGT